MYKPLVYTGNPFYKKIKIVLAAVLLISSTSHAQREWSLRECIEYGVERNPSLNSADVDRRLAELNLKQSKLSRWPSASGSLGYGRSYGRSIDPTTNQFVNNGYWFSSASLNANVLAFGWFQKKYEIESNQLALESSEYNQKAIQDDISLNIATAYLRALLAKKQIALAEQQVVYSQDQISRTQKLVDAGVLPELNYLQVVSQLAQDSSAYIQSSTSYTQAVLQLMAIMNLPFDSSITVKDPYLDGISVSDVLPTDQDIMERALAHRNNIKANQLNVENAEKNYRSIRARKYPSLSLGFTYGTNYASIAQQLAGIDTLGVVPTQYFLYQGGATQPVYTYGFEPLYENTPFFTQLGNNSRSTFSINLSLPIFNGWSAQAAQRQAALNLESREIQLQQSMVQLEQDVLMAKSDAINALQVYKSSVKALENAQKSFELAEKRYNVGLMTTLEFQLEKNNLYSAEVQKLSNQYDYIFKYKVLDFYIGNKIW